MLEKGVHAKVTVKANTREEAFGCLCDAIMALVIDENNKHDIDFEICDTDED